MITAEQRAWLHHLSDTETISIVPYDPRNREVFRRMKVELRKVLGCATISHRGSTALGISGQGEIDLYIPVARKDFDSFLERLTGHLGRPGSVYPLRRARFLKHIDGIKVEIFLINRNSEDWKRSIRFENFLRENPDALGEYERLKSKCNGYSVRRYYTKKIEFINKILAPSLSGA